MIDKAQVIAVATGKVVFRIQYMLYLGCTQNELGVLDKVQVVYNINNTSQPSTCDDKLEKSISCCHD